MTNRRNEVLWAVWILWAGSLWLISGPNWPGGCVVLAVVIILCVLLIFIPVMNGENMFNRKEKKGVPAGGSVPSSVEDAENKAAVSPVMPDAVSLPATLRRCTLLAAGTAITGDVIITGDCQVCGHITGSVILHEGVLRVMKGGRIDGDVTAPAVTLDGSLHGTCDADMVDVLENGYLDGLCRSRQFSIVAGGVFTGQSERRAEPSVTGKDAGNGLSGTVTDLPSRRTLHVSPAPAADTEKGVQADG